MRHYLTRKQQQYFQCEMVQTKKFYCNCYYYYYYYYVGVS